MRISKFSDSLPSPVIISKLDNMKHVCKTCAPAMGLFQRGNKIVRQHFKSLNSCNI